MDVLGWTLIVIAAAALGIIIGAGIFYTPDDFDHPTVDRGEPTWPK